MLEKFQKLNLKPQNVSDLKLALLLIAPKISFFGGKNGENVPFWENDPKGI